MSQSQYDWRSFSEFFYPAKSRAGDFSQKSIPEVIVYDQDRIVSVYSSESDNREWVGRSIAEYRDLFSSRRSVILEREFADQWISEVKKGGFFFDQLAELKRSYLTKYPEPDLVRDHFLFGLFFSRWSRIFPKQFGIFLRIEGVAQNNSTVSGTREIFFVLNNGKLESVQEPQFQALSEGAKSTTKDLVTHLQDRYSIPVQGVILQAQDWLEWSEKAEPWREIWNAYRDGTLELAPHRKWLPVMLFLRAFLGI